MRESACHHVCGIRSESPCNPDLAASVSDQFDKERTSGLRHCVHPGSRRDGVRVPPVKRVAQAEPKVEIPQQTFGGAGERIQVDAGLIDGPGVIGQARLGRKQRGAIQESEAAHPFLSTF